MVSIMSSSKRDKIIPKQSFTSPYLTPLLPNGVSKSVRSAGVRSASATNISARLPSPKPSKKPQSAKKPSIVKLNFGPVKTQNQTTQRVIGDQATPFIDEIQFAMDQMRILDNRRAVNKRYDKRDTFKNVPKNTNSPQEVIKTEAGPTAKGSHTSVDLRGRKPPIPQQRVSKQRLAQAQAQIQATDSKTVLKSILKVKTQPKVQNQHNSSGMPRNVPKNRIMLSDGVFKDFDLTSSGEGYTQRHPKSNKKVRFFEEVVIHPVPYESRGSTEWQHNLLMSMESRGELQIPSSILSIFSGVFGEHSSNPHNNPPDSIRGVTRSNHNRRRKF